MSASTEQPATTQRPLFERILCVTSVAAAGAEAVRQAAALAGPGGTIDLVSVAPERPPGMPRPQAEQIEALVTGTQMASAAGVSSEPHIVEAIDEPTGVLERCTGHDLVVVPAGATGFGLFSSAPHTDAIPAPRSRRACSWPWTGRPRRTPRRGSERGSRRCVVRS